MAEVLKKCSCCGGEKCTTEFYSKGTRTDSRCKACVLRLKKQKAKARKKALAKTKVCRGNTIPTPNVFRVKVTTLPQEPITILAQMIEDL